MRSHLILWFHKCLSLCWLMWVEPNINTILKQGEGFLRDVHLFVFAFSKFKPNKVSKYVSDSALGSLVTFLGYPPPPKSGRWLVHLTFIWSEITQKNQKLQLLIDAHICSSTAGMSSAGQSEQLLFIKPLSTHEENLTPAAATDRKWWTKTVKTLVFYW